MSPALLAKYLDAAKEVAAHAVLLPDGFRFSPGTTRRDWTDEIARARSARFYAEFTDSGGGTQVNLQGIVFGTNAGGRLPLEQYLAATLAERDALASGAKIVEAVARERELSPKYLGLLWSSARTAPSRRRCSTASAAAGGRRRPADAPALAAEIGRWQKALWKFNSVGHIGKVGGPKAWMEPVTPAADAGRSSGCKLPPPPDGKDVTLYLVAGDAGDGNEHDVGRLGAAAAGRARAARPAAPRRPRRRPRPGGAARAGLRRRRPSASRRPPRRRESRGKFDLAELARKHDVEPDVARGLARLPRHRLGRRPVTIRSHLTDKIAKAAGYDFVNGWGRRRTAEHASPTRPTSTSASPAT